MVIFPAFSHEKWPSRPLRQGPPAGQEGGGGQETQAAHQKRTKRTRHRAPGTEEGEGEGPRGPPPTPARDRASGTGPQAQDEGEEGGLSHEAPQVAMLPEIGAPRDPVGDGTGDGSGMRL